MKVKKAVGILVNLFFPADCKVCGQPLEPLNHSFICRSCWNKVKWLKSPCCAICSKPLSSKTSQEPLSLICPECQRNHPHFNKIFVPFVYEGVIRKAIHLLKYNGKIGVIRGIRRIMEIYFAHNHIPLSLNLVVPVPLHRRKFKERGFNQAEILARIIARYFGLKLVKNNIKKVKSTRAQAELSKRERMENVRGAFRVRDKIAFQDRDILLVDDVYTTGATVREIAKMLKELGTGDIYVFTLARAC